MPTDPRITKAKKALRDGLAKGKQAEDEASNRATGTRAKYKQGFLAAEAALEQLNAK